MKLFFLSLILFFPFCVFAQSTATVDITFQNAKIIKIERRPFFKFKKPDNFKITILDKTHYLLNYLDTKPGVVFINERPVLITPGDDVKLTYKLIVWDYEDFKDTISATGNNAKNYTYSNFATGTRLIKGDIFPDLRIVKYQTNSLALYADLVKAYAFRDAWYDSFLKKYGYDKSFADYIKRTNNIEFLVNAVALETELATNYKKQLPPFAEKVHAAFQNTDFIPADTNYTYRMEETFYTFFWHLAHEEFYPLDSRKNFDSLLNFVIKYPNPFVKEYFLFFFIIDYNKIWREFRPESLVKVIKSIKNPAIKEALKNYTY
ncbi:MAG: hypothetical protein ACHQIM_01105 [Sphingobacteriales bacterium]